MLFVVLPNTQVFPVLKILYLLGVFVSVLRCLSPAELSRHAVELEKRSMQLSVEEGTYVTKLEKFQNKIYNNVITLFFFFSFEGILQMLRLQMV